MTAAEIKERARQLARDYLLKFDDELPLANFERIRLEVEAGAKHCGDCTHQAQTCIVCWLQDFNDRVDQLAPIIAASMTEAAAAANECEYCDGYATACVECLQKKLVEAAAQARLEEAKWWRDYVGDDEWNANMKLLRERIAELEAAVKSAKP